VDGGLLGRFFHSNASPKGVFPQLCPWQDQNKGFRHDLTPMGPKLRTHPESAHRPPPLLDESMVSPKSRAGFRHSNHCG
jgi:hypothetical protein